MRHAAAAQPGHGCCCGWRQQHAGARPALYCLLLFPAPQGILLVSVIPSLLAMYGTGWALDRGAPAVRLNALVVTAGAGAGEHPKLP